MKKQNLTWGPSSRPQRSQEPRTLADQALIRIRQDIIGGRLSAGQKLQPDLLEVEYGIGRSPVREALSRLATEGLRLPFRSRRGRSPASTLSHVPRHAAALNRFRYARGHGKADGKAGKPSHCEIGEALGLDGIATPANRFS